MCMQRPPRGDCRKAGTLIESRRPNGSAFAALSWRGGASVVGVAGRPMDRLLHYLLKTFIRRGTFRVTTSRGTTFTFGDGTGALGRGAVYHAAQPNAASCSIPSSSSAKPIWTAASWSKQGTIADVLAIVLGQNGRSCRSWARPQWLMRYLGRRSRSSIRARARAATSRTITISTAGSIRCSSTPTGNTAAPISRIPRSVARRRPARQEAPSRRQAAARARQARARHRLRLGRAWALSRRDSPAPTSPASRCRRSKHASPTSARPRRA